MAEGSTSFAPQRGMCLRRTLHLGTPAPVAGHPSASRIRHDFPFAQR